MLDEGVIFNPIPPIEEEDATCFLVWAVLKLDDVIHGLFSDL